jgi:glycosyltransferase involved in cell wall biosynthesis
MSGISVIMATYNGERYLREQLNSLLAQTATGFTLYVNDDCSVDDTIILLKQYSQQYPGKIVVSSNKANSGSAKYNFLSVIERVKDDYVFLADQDDYWRPDKIEKSLAKMEDMEAKCGKNTPILVHTDLTVVDSELNVIAPSYREQVLHPDWNTFGLAQSLMMNIATGSTICYNRALAELVKIPKFVVMHDWWLLQTALLFGKVGHVFDKTVLYRQHGGNELGSSNVKTLKYKILRFIHHDKVRQRFLDSYEQTAELIRQYGGELNSEQLELLMAYANLPKLHRAKRVCAALKMGVLNTSFSRKIGAIMFM